MQTRRTITTILAAAALVAAPAALAMQPAGSTRNTGGNSMARALARRLSRTNNDSEQANRKKKHPYGLGSLNGARHRSSAQPGAGVTSRPAHGGGSERHSPRPGESSSAAPGSSGEQGKQHD